MADGTIGVDEPVTIDLNVDTENMGGVPPKHRERIQIAGAALAEIARVLNADPSSTDYGLVVRMPRGVSSAIPIFDDPIDRALRDMGKIDIAGFDVALPAGTNVIGGVSGDVAHDGVDSGNPIKVGGKASVRFTPPAAVAAADRANFDVDTRGRLRVIVSPEKALGGYRAHSGRLTILASAHAATAGFFWLINPVASGVVVTVTRLRFVAGTTAASAFISSPRVTIELVTFTGAASGATITPAKRDSTDATNVATVRTASTGLTLTAGATAKAFLVPSVMTAVGVAPSTEQLWRANEEDDFLILRAGEGIVCRQADAGTASDTRVAIVDLAWEEY